MRLPTPDQQYAYRHPGAALDVTRGVEERFSFALGFGVLRYSDTPDVYYDAAGNVVPFAIAERAGYDVDGDKVLGHQAREMAALQARMKETVQERKATAPGGLEIVKESDHYQLVKLGPEQGQILIKDATWTDTAGRVKGRTLTGAQPMAEAKALFDALALDD